MKVKALELECYQAISIEAEEHDESLAKCHPQEPSPLFSTLPREIRDLIWSFATMPVEDETRKYNTNEYYCRPGHRAPHKTYTDLLYTCRRVWLEANALPMLQAEQCFWYYRAAPDSRDAKWMGNLTETNRRNFGHLHLFSQMYAIEGLTDRKGDLQSKFLTTPERPGDFQPKALHVTVRHTDWWWWESDAPLRFEDHWLKALLDTPDLRSTQVLTLELETLDYKVGQLMPIVERLKRLESNEYATHLIEGGPAQTKFVLTGEPEIFNWTGPSNIDGHDHEPYQGKATLKYHVVTLTWHLRFPEMPRANVAKLRRAPRLGNRDPLALLPSSASSFDTRTPDRPQQLIELERYLSPYGDPNYAPRDAARMRRRGAPLPARSARSETAVAKARYERHRFQFWSTAQIYLRSLQKWQQDVHGAVERGRFRSMMAPHRMETWEERWRREGSLLRFQ